MKECINEWVYFHVHEKFYMKLFGHMNQQQAHIVVSKHTSNK